MSSTILLCSIIAIVVTGCGSSTPKLTVDESYKVSDYEVAFSSTVLDGREYGKTLKGVDYLIGLCRRKPTAIYDGIHGKVTMVQLLEDAANDFEGYQARLAAQLGRVARDKCA